MHFSAKTIGVGVDILYSNRFANLNIELFATKILSNGEFILTKSMKKSTKMLYLAKKWCAKEAIFKAIPKSKHFLRNLKYIEIFNDELGAPYVNILDPLHSEILDSQGQYQLQISISDEKDVIVAFCIMNCIVDLNSCEMR